MALDIHHVEGGKITQSWHVEEQLSAALREAQGHEAHTRELEAEVRERDRDLVRDKAKSELEGFGGELKAFLKEQGVDVTEAPAPAPARSPEAPKPRWLQLWQLTASD